MKRAAICAAADRAVNAAEVSTDGPAVIEDLRQLNVLLRQVVSALE